VAAVSSHNTKGIAGHAHVRLLALKSGDAKKKKKRAQQKSISKTFVASDVQPPFPRSRIDFSYFLLVNGS
jgi:hypothetical protein